MPRSIHILLLLITLPMSAASAQSGGARAATRDAAGDESNGRLVIVGGGLSRTTEAVYRAILDGRRLDGPVCVIPTAGADPDASTASAVAAFERWGGQGTAAGIPVSTANPEAAHDAAVVRAIGECAAFYFTGGVQSRIVQVFRPDGRDTPALTALINRFRAGAVVAGSSAGAAVMSDPMIAGGSTTLSLQHGVEEDSDDADEGERGLVIERGVGFFPAAIVDQHFLARGRIGRLIAAVLDLDEFDLGFGIDENTALVVDGDSVRVAGESGVIIVDESDARRTGRSATNVRMHLLAPGDRFSTTDRRVTPAAGRYDLPASSDSVAVPDDVFARWAFLHLLNQFAQSPQTTLTLPVPGGEVVLRKGPDFAARSRGERGVQGTPAGLSITGLLLDVKR
ncbi:MAG TPA: cyanophycinase [Longimicrobiales bacterium]|nr:cyanophycinase [Longimicrobiales bacterium]